jgi:ABC-2 type transport system permease protein
VSAALRTLGQIYDATRLQLRTSYRELGLLLGFVIVFPLGFLFFLNVIVQPALRPQVLVGSIMMEVALLNINVVAQSIGQDKESKMYDLWVSFPMNPVVYVSAIAFAMLPYSVLSAALTLAVGMYAFHIAVSAGLGLILLAFLLVWASTLGIGFLIGVYGRSPRAINSVAQLVGIIMTFFAPVFYPISVLPAPAQWLAFAWPVTWGAILLKALLFGQVATAGTAAAVLAGFSIGWFALIAVGLRWRQV